MKILVILLFLFVYVEFSELKNLDEVGEAPATDISTLSTISSTSTETQSTPVQDGTTLSSVQSENPSSSPKPDLKEKLDLSDVIVKNSSNMNISLIDNLSNQIRIILKHFQHPDPIGLPGKSILPEPMLAENVTASLVVATGSFFNIEIYGLNNFSISVINTFLDRMEVFVVLRLKSATALGNYTITNMVVNNEGPFNITFTNVTAAGTVGLAINEQGQLYANKSAIDISYEEMEVDLTNVSAFVRPFLNSGGAQIFNTEKKYILDNVNERLMAEINRRLEFFPKIPPLTKISPVDLAVMEGRKFVKSRYEPYIIDKVFDFDNPFLSINVGPVSIQGLSKFAHVGNISLDMVNQTVDLRIRIITSKLLGNCKWYYDIGKVGVTRHGQSNFSISHLQFEARVRQPVDSRKPPVLEELEIETGPIYVKMDGRGSFDYIVEMVVKMLPKMLRHMIIDALEEPIKQKIQTDVLDRISVERVYEENLPDIKKYLSDKI